jgi:hypothetical protein
MTIRSTLLLLAATSSLAAQRVPLPGNDGRMVQLFDLRTVRAPRAPGPDLVVKAAGEQPARADEEEGSPGEPDHAAIAALVARFVDPPLGTGDALQPLGEHFLVLLGSAAQAASIERMLGAVAARRANSIDFELRLLKLDAATFERVVRPLVDAVGADEAKRYEKLLPKADAGKVGALLAADVETIEAPRLLLRPLTRATMSLAKQISYIKDFTITAQNGALIADPMIDVAVDGITMKIDATFLPEALIGFSCDVTVQSVEQPLREYSTTLPGAKTPVTIQLPCVRGVRLQHSAIVHDGDVVVLAAKQADGTFLVALATLHERKG